MIKFEKKKFRRQKVNVNRLGGVICFRQIERSAVTRRPTNENDNTKYIFKTGHTDKLRGQNTERPNGQK